MASGAARRVAGDAAARPGPRAAGDALQAVSGAPQSAHQLDPLIHQRSRLGIISALAAADQLSFNELKRLLRISDGNLSVHARKLETAGYVHCDKGFDGRVPHTEYRLTPKGNAALTRYLDHMEALIGAARSR
ncbi:MAG: winged helix-turn-helix domain-containing protein [Gemmatimonadota bacterium]